MYIARDIQVDNAKAQRRRDLKRKEMEKSAPGSGRSFKDPINMVEEEPIKPEEEETIRVQPLRAHPRMRKQLFQTEQALQEDSVNLLIPSNIR